MKPFDLEAAKRGEPIVTRDGRSARFLAHVPEATGQRRVVAYVIGGRGALSFYESGLYDEGVEMATDLLMASRIVYLNLYRNGVASWHNSKEAANYPDEEPLHQAVPVEI